MRIADNRWHPYATITLIATVAHLQGDKLIAIQIAVCAFSPVSCSAEKEVCACHLRVNPESYGQPGTTRYFPASIPAFTKRLLRKCVQQSVLLIGSSLFSSSKESINALSRSELRNHPAISAHHYYAAFSAPAQRFFTTRRITHGFQRNAKLQHGKPEAASARCSQISRSAPSEPFADGPTPAQRKTVRRIYWFEIIRVRDRHHARIL